MAISKIIFDPLPFFKNWHHILSMGQGQNTLVISHRGLTQKFPENTISAFGAAMEMGADGFECDVWVSSDGHAVIHHDFLLDKTCGMGCGISSLELKELQKIKSGDEKLIPSVEDTLASFPDAVINLEIKPVYLYKQTIDSIMKSLRRVKRFAPVVLSSWFPQQLNYGNSLRRNRGLAESAFVMDLPFWGDRLIKNYYRIKNSNACVSMHKKLLRRMVSHGIESNPVWLWTLNEEKDWEEAFSAGVPIQAMITDRPIELRAYLNQNSLKKPA